ncbi:MAG: magnesium transporter [Candidatus Rifleibacteriota bacterium]
MNMKNQDFFLKNIIGSPVYSPAGRNCGYIADFALKLKKSFPEIQKAIIFIYETSDYRIADKSDFEAFVPSSFKLAKPVAELPVFSENNKLITATQLWDKSVIDTVNVRTVQINDLKLHLHSNGRFFVTGIDISFSAALRRLGLEKFPSWLLKKLGFNLQEEIISWNKIIGFSKQFSSLTPKLTSDNLQNLHPADLADLLDELEDPDRLSILENLDEEIAADTLGEADAETQLRIIQQLDPQAASELIDEMDPDEAADLLQDLDPEKARLILAKMNIDDAIDVKELLRHHEDTAGGLMTTEYAAIFEDFTVKEAFDHLRLIATDIEIIYYMYIIDPEEKLKGVVSIRDLLAANPSAKISEIMDDDLVVVYPDTEQEEVASLMNKYDYMAIPVVNYNDQITGVVTIDDIMDVMEEEASEDMFKFAGSSEEELNYTSPLQACRARLPWLLITLATGFITSSILKSFMADFNHVLVLAFFVPVVMAMGGNTGIQSSTLLIRGMALNTYSGSELLKRLLSEIVSGALMGLSCGLVVGIWAEYLISTDAAIAAAFSPFFLALTVGIAMMSAMTFAALFGALVPILFERLKIDPAVASGPFVTSSNDIFALIIYYVVSLFMLSYAAL